MRAVQSHAQNCGLSEHLARKVRAQPAQRLQTDLKHAVLVGLRNVYGTDALISSWRTHLHPPQVVNFLISCVSSLLSQVKYFNFVSRCSHFRANAYLPNSSSQRDGELFSSTP